MGERVVVCRKCKHHQTVTDFLTDDTDATVELVRCQKVCEGSLVGLTLDGRLEWFAPVHKTKALSALAHVIAAGRADMSERCIPKALAKRRLSERSGRPPR